MSKVPYASIVDSLMYAMVCTRPDIAQVVKVVNRYMSNQEEALESYEVDPEISEG